MTLGPFDLAGGPFLMLYGFLFLAAFATSLWIDARLRPEGREQALDDPDALALLAGGRTRFVDGVITRLLARGDLRMVGKDGFAARPGVGRATAAENCVLSLPAPAKWPTVVGALNGYAEPVERRLKDAGLLLSDGEAFALRWWRTLPFMLVAGFGAIKWEIGTLRERPVGFLTGLLILTLGVAAFRWFALDRKTKAAHLAVAQAKVKHDRIRLAPTTDETGLAVALFGTSVLAGSALAEYHRLRQASGDSGSVDGGSSGDGGGGGCGGGCGGCGG